VRGLFFVEAHSSEVRSLFQCAGPDYVDIWVRGFDDRVRSPNHLANGRDEIGVMYTNTRLGNVKRVFRGFPAVLLAIGLAACGGSTSGSAPGMANPARASSGSITGFGSIHVNGVKYETTSAVITVNGQAGVQGDLRVGDVVDVSGHHDDATNLDIADTVKFRHDVQGPISSINTIAGTLGVLGQNVVVGADTFFGTGITPASLAGLAVNDIIEVSGLLAPNGDIHAMRIEKKAAGAEFEVTGVAASTNVTAKTLMINALTVDFSAATLSGFPSSGPKDGDRVDATGISLGSAGELKATRLEFLASAGPFSANEDGSIEGLITRFASASDFDVSGQPVATSAGTTFAGGVSTDLALGVHLDVEGAITAAGVLDATQVHIHLPSASATRLLGPVTMVDTAAGTVTVLGITVSVTNLTHFEDDGSQDVNTFQLSDVHVGDWLDVRGGESPAASNNIVATRFVRVEPQSSVRVAGTVKTAVPPSFTILSLNIVTTPATTFTGASNTSVTANAFFLNLIGQTATIVGVWDGTTVTAQQAFLGEGQDN